MTRPIVILVAGSTVDSVRGRRGDFVDWFAQGLGRALPRQESAATSRTAMNAERNAERKAERNDARLRSSSSAAGPELVVFDARDEAAPAPDLDVPGRRPAGVVVTGSASMITEESAWSLRAERWLARAVDADVPVLGVCYGHQMLARIAGGVVDWNPRGREIGTVDVELTELARQDPLFAGCAPRFAVQTSHSQSVTRLPPGAEVLARSALDPCSALRLEGKRAWGVQFHPEFDADIVRGYVQERAGELVAEGLDPEALADGVRDDPAGATLLRRFDTLCRSWASADASSTR